MKTYNLYSSFNIQINAINCFKLIKKKKKKQFNKNNHDQSINLDNLILKSFVL